MKIFMDGMNPSSGGECDNFLLKTNLIASLEIHEKILSLAGTFIREDGKNSDVSCENICFPVY